MKEIADGIVILGAGGFAREVYHHMVPYCPVSQYLFVDDVTDVTELFCCQVIKDWSFPELGVRSSVMGKVPSVWKFVVGVGDPRIKRIMVEKALEAGLAPLDTWVHPNALVQDAELGKGGIICPGAVITTNVTLGDYVTVNLNTTIGHDTEIADYVNISPGCNISGNNLIKESANIGTGTVTREEVIIGNSVIIGAQSCVINDCDVMGEVYVGTPARPITNR